MVRALCAGHEVSGLHVGVCNARRYFPKGVSAIELQLDHLRIECGLTPDFWHGRPEIRDPRLILWLKSKSFMAQLSGTSASIAMIPSGENSYKLESAARHAKQPVRHAPLAAD
jgi:hypothetical protein